ncbi:MAG: putative selenate reductase subunit YgfK [Candidatus Bipolaricaulota bacterium]|nr:putative selenate reductase subunit YgfK [Candidatus Bipolaricaulota bacterium]
MSDTMKVQPFARLLRWILRELETNQSIFGIPRSLFFVPQDKSPYETKLFGDHLATPIGPAAGPHTQCAQNIVCAWLSGGRFIELKTVQVMDELRIPRPCIDVADEGYNVEWSQELKLDQSAGEYIKAWVLIHILRRVLGFAGRVPFGTIFNMSVGYDLEGIKNQRMLNFMDRLEDASEEIAEIRSILSREFPQYADIEIPPRLTNNVTLSTMHGCPPDEIERIARYLLEGRGLNTTVKLNPTLLGRETVQRILHDDLGYREIRVPAAVFDNDLKYERAVSLIKALKQTATGQGLTVGIKLSNTLAVVNHKGVLPGEEMYMSGRALYPITMALLNRLLHEFDGDLNVSYAGGADALNVVDILSTGAYPVTCASDLLKPGGYSRLLQYLENIERAMAERGLTSLHQLADAGLMNLEDAANRALVNPRYKKAYHPYGSPKVKSGLSLFDCIAAPCVEGCAICQDVPEYVWLIANGKYDQALKVILSRNPLPGVTGYICNHPCQSRCTRNDYDVPVAIRALKRFAVEHGNVTVSAAEGTGHRVAVVGSGPSGLSAASFLALNGVEVTIYEAKGVAGGMLTIAPAFRLPRKILDSDIARITEMGVRIELDHPIDSPERLLKKGFAAVYIGCGAQRDVRLPVDGSDGDRVFPALSFLRRVAQGSPPELGEKVLVIGGGNTAIDAARTAARLIGNPVTVLYRRRREQMPADQDEIEDLLVEKNILEELLSPKRIIRGDERGLTVECVRNRLGEPGADGRRRPVPIGGSQFVIAADSVITAIGQQLDSSLFGASSISLSEPGRIDVDPETGLTSVDYVYAGGDAVRGPATIVQACADGRRAAEAICRRLGIPFRHIHYDHSMLSEEEILALKRTRARKEPQYLPEVISPAERTSFDLVEKSTSEAKAKKEAARCMQCSSLCDKCVEVCPNRANYTYTIPQVDQQVPLLACHDDKLVVVGAERFQINQTRQIIHIDDLCNQCGNCATFCVHPGRPYLEKPRLFLREEDFLREADNAFYMEEETIRRREGGDETRLLATAGAMVFEDKNVSVILSSDFEIRQMTLKEPFTGILSLKRAAEMAVLQKAVSRSLPFLL